MSGVVERGALLSARQNLSLRDYFAAAALATLEAADAAAAPQFRSGNGPATIAALAYGIADAMLEEREKTL